MVEVNRGDHIYNLAPSSLLASVTVPSVNASLRRRWRQVRSCQDFEFSRIRFVFHAHTSGFGITL